MRHDSQSIGHDIGGMVAYAYLREFTNLSRAVIMDVPVPGVDPWDDFVREPFLWHFALHAVPGLPELLIQGKPSRGAYASPGALRTGFDWYRAFPADAERNSRTGDGVPVD